MPRDANGNYTLPAGNPVVTGTPIETAWANPTLGDVATEMTNSLDRNGRGGMLAPFRFADGAIGAPSLTFTSETTTGIYRAGASDFRATVGGVARMRWTAAGVDIWDGSGWAAVITAAGTVTIAGAQTITGAKTFQNADTDILTLTRVSTTLGPRIRFGNTDGATGFLLIADDGSLTFADAAGVSRFTINASGSLTIGSIPYARLTDMTANVMLLTGNQTVAGIKTFSSALVLPAASIADASLTANVPLKNATNIFTGGNQFPTIELGHATDTTLARIAAGRVSIEGGEIAKLNAAQTFAAAITFSVAALFADGTLAAPGIAFSGDANTGLHRIGADNFALVTNGVARVSLNAPTGARTSGALLQHADGSVYDGGFNVQPTVEINGADLTLAIGNAGKLIRKFDTAARNLNIPASTDLLPVGSTWNYIGWNPGAVTVTVGAGCTLTWMDGTSTPPTGARTLSQGGVATIVRVDSTRWYIWGSGIS